MATALNSLWPTDFGVLPLLTPVGILREQAVALGQQTSNIVVGHVITTGDNDVFVHRLNLYCSPLGYETPLLNIRHGVEFYPVQIHVMGNPTQMEAADEEQLKRHLKEIFAREKTRKVVAMLLAQSKQ